MGSPIRLRHSSSGEGPIDEGVRPDDAADCRLPAPPPGRYPGVDVSGCIIVSHTGYGAPLLAGAVAVWATVTACIWPMFQTSTKAGYTRRVLTSLIAYFALYGIALGLGSQPLPGRQPLVLFDRRRRSGRSRTRGCLPRTARMSAPGRTSASPAGRPHSSTGPLFHHGRTGCCGIAGFQGPCGMLIQVSDSVLSKQLAVLEKAGYVKIRKGFAGEDAADVGECHRRRAQSVGRTLADPAGHRRQSTPPAADATGRRRMPTPGSRLTFRNDATIELPPTTAAAKA